MEDCCSNYKINSFPVECDNRNIRANSIAAKPIIILNNGNVYDGDLNYMGSGELNGKTILFDPTIKVTARQLAKDKKMIKAAYSEQKSPRQ